MTLATLPHLLFDHEIQHALVVWWRGPFSVSLASTLFCFLSKTRQQQKRYQPVPPLCGFALRSMTCRQPLVPPTNHLHTHHPQAVPAALVRKGVRKWVRKCARKPETCVCVVFRAVPKICGGSCGAFWGSFLDSVCGHAVLALHTYGYANTFLRKHPSRNKTNSMGGNCMKKWEVQKRTIMQLNYCTTGWLPCVNGLRELCIRSLVGQQGDSCN